MPPEPDVPWTKWAGWTSLIGTLVGAGLAFGFNYLLSWLTRFRTQRNAAHKVLISLMNQTNNIVLIQKDQVEQHLDHPFRFIEIPATADFDLDQYVFDIDDLEFMLSKTEGRKILYDVLLAQATYIEALRTWNLRSQLHQFEIQPKLADGLGEVEDVSRTMIREAIGFFNYRKAENATKNALTLLKQAFIKLEDVRPRLRAYAVRYFGTEEFTEAEFPEHRIMENDGDPPPVGSPGAVPPSSRVNFYERYYPVIRTRVIWE